MTTDKPREKGIQTDPRMPMTSNELIASLREMKKTNPAEYAVFQKDYAEEMTEGVAYWGVNDGYLTLWKLTKDAEDDFDAGDFGNKWCLGDEWGGFSGVQTRTITKKMMERGTFEEHESDDEESDDEEEEPVKEEPVIVKKPTVVKDNKEEDKKAMKEYVKARLNHLMGLGQKQMNEDGGDGAVECLFTRREEWDGEVFDNIICSLCDKREGEMNKSVCCYEFSVGAKMPRDADDKVWEVSVSWSTLYDQNPFDDFYDEDEDNGSDSDDE